MPCKSYTTVLGVVDQAIQYDPCCFWQPRFGVHFLLTVPDGVWVFCVPVGKHLLPRPAATIDCCFALLLPRQRMHKAATIVMHRHALVAMWSALLCYLHVYV